MRHEELTQKKCKSFEAKFEYPVEYDDDDNGALNKLSTTILRFLMKF